MNVDLNKVKQQVVQAMGNRYAKLTWLTLAVGALLFLVIVMVSAAAGLKDFPWELQALLAFLSSGFLVYKFLSQRVF